MKFVLINVHDSYEQNKQEVLNVISAINAKLNLPNGKTMTYAKPLKNDNQACVVITPSAEKHIPAEYIQYLIDSIPTGSWTEDGN